MQKKLFLYIIFPAKKTILLVPVVPRCVRLRFVGLCTVSRARGHLVTLTRLKLPNSLVSVGFPCANRPERHRFPGPPFVLVQLFSWLAGGEHFSRIRIFLQASDRSAACLNETACFRLRTALGGARGAQRAAIWPCRPWRGVPVRLWRRDGPGGAGKRTTPTPTAHPVDEDAAGRA